MDGLSLLNNPGECVSSTDQKEHPHCCRLYCGPPHHWARPTPAWPRCSPSPHPHTSQADLEEGRESGRDLQHYQSQAKQLCRKLNAQSPNRCTLEAGVMSFHYVLEHGVCYLALCEAVFPKRLVFGYLEDLQTEFHEQHGKKVSTVSRPYSFIEFDTYIQKTKKTYIDSRARRNLGSINTELQDVQRIMVANIEEVLQRGEALSALDTKASNLSSLSKKYRSDAKYLNTRSTYAKIAAGAVFFITLIVYVRFWWI
uniref:SEC22 homolog B, vesicle trafficking protein a n=1 Tax=Oncorhynchus kisutch TaxID=8019 RepID=A0A8C7I4D1_ONCKI